MNNFNDNIFYKVQDLLQVKPMQDILDSLGIVYNSHSNGQVIRGKCPDHYLYTGRYPSGDSDWAVNVRTGQTFCHTQKRGSNILMIAKRLKNFQTLQQAFNFISEGYKIKDKFQKFVSGEKRIGFTPKKISSVKKINDSQKVQFEQKINNATKLVESAVLNQQTVDFFLKDGIRIDTVRKFNVVSLQSGYSKYRCLIPFYDHVNLNKMVGYVSVNTLGKHQYIKRMGRILFKLKNIHDWKNIRYIYSVLIQKYKKAIYLKNSLMRQNLFGLNVLLKDNANLDDIYLVQGQRDAMKMQQQGFPCVGTHGSHVSVQQLNIMRFVGVKNVYLLFDGDNAGRQGAEKAVQLILSHGFRVYNIDPKDKDPKKYNRQQMLNLISSQLKKQGQWDGLINDKKFNMLFKR